MDPLVSIIVPFYNSESTLELALLSIVAQTYQQWECILVNDGSTDNWEDIYSKFSKDKRYKIISLEKNMGRGVARNIAINECTGKYIAMLDADDWWFVNKLDVQVSFMECNENVGISSCSMARFGENNTFIDTLTYCDKIKVYPSIEKPLVRIPFSFPASIIKCEIAKKTKFDVRLKRVEDYDFLQRILYDHSYAILPDVLYAYDFSNTQSIRQRALSAYYKVFASLKSFKRSPIISILNSLYQCLKFLAFPILMHIRYKSNNNVFSNTQYYNNYETMLNRKEYL